MEQDRSAGTSSRGQLAQGKHASPGGTGLEGLPAIGERWTTEVGLSRLPSPPGPHEGSVAPPQFFSLGRDQKAGRWELSP